MKQFDRSFLNRSSWQCRARYWRGEMEEDEEKCPECVHLWVKCLIYNAFLRVSGRKNLDIFPRGAFL